jgi:hypothetical protein
MTVEGGKCSKCGKGPPRLGGHYAPNAFCACTEITRSATPRAPRRDPAIETSSLGIIEQLGLLRDLRLQGAITQEEFVALKSKLITGGV